MTTTTITSKGQIVIPSRIRKHLNIQPGMKFVLKERGNTIIVEPVNEHYFGQFVGILKSKKNLAEELRKEKHKEDAQWQKKISKYSTPQR